MEQLTLTIFVASIVVVLFCFCVLFIYILKLQRKAKLLAKDALLEGTRELPGEKKEKKQ